MKVNEEIQRLLKVIFIMPVRYVEWLSNIILVVKKNTKLRVFVDFKNINLTTPKDEYLIPVANMLIDRVARHQYLFFIDGYLSYN